MASDHDEDVTAAGPQRAGRAEAVRHAVDQAFRGTAGQGAAAAESGRERVADIVDQLAHAAGRVRGVLDDVRPPTGEELRALRERVAALERRVEHLEAAASRRPPAPDG